MSFLLALRKYRKTDADFWLSLSFFEFAHHKKLCLLRLCAPFATLNPNSVSLNRVKGKKLTEFNRLSGYTWISVEWEAEENNAACDAGRFCV